MRDLNELRLSEDEPDSPAYVRDRTPLKKGEITTLALRDEFRRNPALPILIGDNVFIRGVRRGIEQGEYVYRCGELVFGPDDPSASIRIDEQSLIFTMARARNADIWPRKKPDEPIPTTERTGEDRGAGAVEDRGKGRPMEKAPDTFTAEGLLKEALLRLWELARATNVESIGFLTIRMFEAGDAFRLFGAVGAVSEADKVVMIKGGYETRDGGEFELDFRGPVSDAQPVREFLEPQLRAANDGSFEVGFELIFSKGLSMKGEAAEKLSARLARFASGAAHVSATARVKD